MNFVECPIPKTVGIRALYTAFEAHFDKNYSFVGETHDFWEIVFVLDGSLGVCAGNQVLTLGSGDAILHEPMEFHRLWSENETSPSIIVITFSGNMPKITKKIFELPESELEAVKKIFSAIIKSYERNSLVIKNPVAHKKYEAELCVREFECLILRLINEHTKAKLTVNANHSKSALTYVDVVRFLENHVDADLSVDDIAAGCNMSRSNLKKIFTKYSGIGVMKYFNMLKIRQAENYLKTGMSVGEVAAKLGYCDQNYFSTVFKKIAGCSPSEYTGR